MKKILLIVSLLVINLVDAQTLNTDKLDSLFEKIESHNKGMGSIAVSHAGKIIYTKSVGFSTYFPTGNIMANTTTKYRIGPITRMFTATLVFQAIDEGKLKPDTKLSVYFPELPNAQKITIAHLLGHCSGLHNFTDYPAYGNYMLQPLSQAQVLEIIGSSPVDFQPDEKVAYSNSNYVALGMILEKIWGKPYSELVERRIVQVIGLEHTYVGNGDADILKNESLSYDWIDGWKVMPETALCIPLGAGAILSTPSDLTKFIAALFGDKLISPESMAEMKKMKDGYGKGMFEYLLTSVGKIGYGHSGSIDGFSSMLLTIPQDQLTVAYCSNGGSYPVNDIIESVLKDFYGRPYEMPVFKTPVLTPEELAIYKGVYTSKDIYLNITITVRDGTLVGQVTGQTVFPLEATDPHEFHFDEAGIILRFDPQENSMILKQNGTVYHFKRL